MPPGALLITWESLTIKWNCFQGQKCPSQGRFVWFCDMDFVISYDKLYTCIFQGVGFHWHPFEGPVFSVYI